jgi:hypothetical protein
MENPIPEQNTGSEMDITAHTQFNDEQSAITFYQLAKQRLLAMYNWYEICQVPVSTFILTDSNGVEVNRPVQQGDYLKIDIPGPGTATGDGYDWVKVEEVIEENEPEEEQISITVRPSANPTSNKDDIAHFFKDTATSTFQVSRKGNEVHAEVHGRNELANNQTHQVTDNIRNTLVGWSAKLGLSFPQWKSLVNGLMKN